MSSRDKHGAERAAGRDDAGGEGLRIAVAPHLGIGHRREGRRRGDRRARDRGQGPANFSAHSVVQWLSITFFWLADMASYLSLFMIQTKGVV
jgi:hypothetical protein